VRRLQRFETFETTPFTEIDLLYHYMKDRTRTPIRSIMDLEMNVNEYWTGLLKSSSSSFGSGPNHGITRRHVDEMHCLSSLVSTLMMALSLHQAISQNVEGARVALQNILEEKRSESRDVVLFSSLPIP
jgi:hypothetical protein